jgi:hypothetical protein
MMVKGLQLGVHGTRLTDGADTIAGGINLYAASLNLISLVICLILAGGTFAAMRQRAKNRQQQPSAAPVLRASRLRSHPPAVLNNS